MHTNLAMLYPLVICCIAIEHGPFMVDLPIKHGDFPFFLVCLPEGTNTMANKGCVCKVDD